MKGSAKLWLILIMVLLIGAGFVVFYFSSQSQLGELPTLNTLYSVKEEPGQKLCPPEQGIYYGAFPDLGDTEDQVSQARIERFEVLGDKKLIWVYFSNNWGKKIEFPQEAVEIISRYGALPFIRMMPWTEVEQDKQENQYTLDRIKNGDFDQDLRRWARQAKATKIPLLVDFAVEMNGEWFPWNAKWYGANIAGAHKFRDSYRHIIDLFREEQVENITWFFHFDTQPWPEAKWNQAKNYYPGDQYIDWLAISAYGAQTAEYDQAKYLSDILAENWWRVKKVSENKPVALLEFAIMEGSKIDKATWIKDAFETVQKEKYSRIKAVSWWSECWQNEDESWSDLRINSSQNSLEAYKKAIKDESFITKPNYCSK